MAFYLRFIVLFTLLQLSIIIIAVQYIGQDINCTNNEQCIIECSDYRSCALSFIHCNNATKCIIKCNASQSCNSATIYHTSLNHDIEVNCTALQSCESIQIQYEQHIDVIISKNKSLTFNSLSKAASPSVIISDIATFSDVNINCASESSCTAMVIEINHNIFTITNEMTQNLFFRMNIYCGGVQSCETMQLSVDDNWPDVHQYIQWDDFHISLHCNNINSCQFAVINTEKLKINSLPSSESFGAFYLFLLLPLYYFVLHDNNI